MYELLQEKRSQRKKLHEDAKAILTAAQAEKRDTTEEENSKVDKMYADVDKLAEEIRRLEKSEAEERFLGTVDDRLSPPPKASPAPKETFRSWLFNHPRGEEIPIPIGASAEERAVALTNLAGAIDPVVVSAFEEALKWYGPMWQVSTIIRTPDGSPLYWPTFNDTGNAGTILAEASTATTADPTFSSIVFGAYKVEAKYILISNETLQDSSIPLEPIFGRLMGERIARAANTMFTTKTNGPIGIATTQSGATVGATAAATNAIVITEFIDLEHSVDKAYRSRGSFMMNDAVIKAARKLVDSQNRPLWEPNLQVGQPDSLLGYPLYTNNDMASALSTGGKVAIFGDLSKYQIRVAGGLDVRVAQELFLLNYQTAFFGFLRVDGNLLDAGQDPVKWLAMA